MLIIDCVGWVVVVIDCVMCITVSFFYLCFGDLCLDLTWGNCETVSSSRDDPAQLTGCKKSKN